MPDLVTIETDAVLEVPRDVQLCPYCGAELSVQFSCWSERDDGTWQAEGVELECVTQPELDEDDENSLDAWDDWWSGHSEMPYVYWLPATVAVEKWVNERFCFRMKGD